MFEQNIARVFAVQNLSRATLLLHGLGMKTLTHFDELERFSQIAHEFDLRCTSRVFPVKNRLKSVCTAFSNAWRNRENPLRNEVRGTKIGTNSRV